MAKQGHGVRQPGAPSGPSFVRGAGPLSFPFQNAQLPQNHCLCLKDIVTIFVLDYTHHQRDAGRNSHEQQIGY